jgi:hypothetical protein
LLATPLAITPEAYFFASPGGYKVLAIVRGLEVFVGGSGARDVLNIRARQF